MRWISLAALVVFLLLSAYSFSMYERYYPSITGFSKNPQMYDGRIIEAEGRIYQSDGRYFLETTSNIPVEIVSDKEIEVPKLGSGVVVGRLRGDGTLQVEDIHIEDYHDFKYAVSIAAFLVFLAFFFRAWRISLRGFAVRKRA